MIDIRFLRENPETVKQNIRNKFQDEKLAMVDEVIALDLQSRQAQQEADAIRAGRKKIAKEIGALMAQAKKAEESGNMEEAEAKKQEVEAKKAESEENVKRLEELELLEPELREKINKIMMVIPNISDDSVPFGKDDSENVEIEKFGEPVVPEFEVPYHADIMDSICGLDKEYIANEMTSSRSKGYVRLFVKNKKKNPEADQ